MSKTKKQSRTTLASSTLTGHLGSAGASTSLAPASFSPRKSGPRRSRPSAYLLKSCYWAFCTFSACAPFLPWVTS